MISICAAGTLGKDAELQFLPNGTGVLKFSVACRTGFDKQKQEAETTWLECALFGTRAENLAPMLTKGGKVTVFGTMKERKWLDNEGGKHSKWEANINEVALQSSKPQNSNTDNQWNE